MTTTHQDGCPAKGDRTGARICLCTASPSTVTDTLGVAIQPGDTVMVTSYGWAIPVTSTGRSARVVRITPAGNVVLDDPTLTSNGKSARPGCLAVARRDGHPGHEGNRPRCTCGARDHASCLCQISPTDFQRSQS